ncbi:MAG: hypothetical protein PVJ55_07435 [Anaerolineae bacterium]
MSLVRNERFRFIALVLLLTVMLTILLSRLLGGAVRDIIALPILYLSWIGQLYLRTVPRALIWGSLLLFGLILVLSNVMITRRRTRGSAGGTQLRIGIAPEHSGKVKRLASQIRFTSRSAYFRRRMAQRLGRLMLEALDYGERYGATRLERALNAVGAPARIKAFFREGEEQSSPSRRVGLVGWLRRLFWRRQEEGKSSVGLEEVVRFLEDRLEVL